MTVIPDPTTEATGLWLESYRGEVLGEAYFTRMAQLASDPVEKEKIEYLVRLERSTKEMLVPALRRHGLPTEADPSLLASMAGIDAYSWTKMLAGVRPVAESFLAKYRRLGELAEGDEDAGVVGALVAHEEALEHFCRCEMEGQTSDSLRSILALPHFR
jgi:hypothetical protein